MKNLFFRACAIAIVVASIANADFTTLPAALAKDLASPDIAARVRARQLLPRHGVAALDHLLPLLSSQEQPVKLSAYNVIADIANGAAAPGHEAEREIAATKLMTLVAPGQPEMVVLQGLRLLPIVAPNGLDVGPVAAILNGTDANLRERARECLTLAATDEACDALIDAAPHADAAFAVALLDAVAMLRNPRSLDRAASLLSHGDDSVRVAAARAVAWSGDAKYVTTLRDTAAKSTPETQAAAYDALLRLADAVVNTGGNWGIAMAVYRDVLANAPQKANRAEAMMGLGRYGDATVIDAIVAGAANAGGELDDQAAMALTSLQGGEAVKGAVAAYSSLSEPVRVSMISIWGQQKQTDALDLIAAELNGAPAVRTAALHALASIGSMKGFAALVEVAKSGNDEEREFALNAVKQMAGNLGSTGDKQAAGLVFVQLYALTNDEALRADAVRGIARNPVPQAFDTVKDALGIADLKADAVEAMASVAGALAANKENERAVEAAKLVQSAGAPVETLVRMAASLGDAAPPEFANILGLVRKWQVIGPFKWKNDAAWTTAFVGEPNVDPSKPVSAAGKTYEWKPATGNGPIGLVDLTGSIAQSDRVFGYAYAIVDVADECDGQIRIGSDDGNQIWLNGKQVFENRVDRGSALDQDKVDVHFVKGSNTILAKISQGAGGWNFCLRLAKPDGSGIVFTQP
ncbi:MAG: HEAT repeat domain-containing protein [Candidatus Hydrogenedentes bacterium]|nr:HEAT repeat domain-containing protein [Candidatus Hydrogenedentota bacterium]